MLLKRIISGTLGVLIFILAIYWGNFPFFIFISLVTILALKEFSQITQTNSSFSLILSGMLFLVVSYLNLIYQYDFHLEYFFILILLIFFYENYQKDDLRNILQNISINIFAVIYIVFGLIYFIYLRNLDLQFALWIALIGTWLTDIAAFFVGKYYGKKKLAPKISPNKTIEGALGGIVTSFLFIIAITLYLDIFSGIWVIYGILLPMIAVVGDLFESAIKRAVDVKDSGDLIPGHGGILDRFDSLFFTIPFTYFYLSLLLN
ncbi:MAG: phosphatidate cytidylyltransferase [Halanaerobiales bacterium]|nr:phosphatidate cytidylyltransferase [Halanaerobiales bacterium]